MPRPGLEIRCFRKVMNGGAVVLGFLRDGVVYINEDLAVGASVELRQTMLGGSGPLPFGFKGLHTRHARLGLQVCRAGSNGDGGYQVETHGRRSFTSRLAQEETRQRRSSALIALRHSASQIGTLAGDMGLGRCHCSILLAHALAFAVRNRDTVYSAAPGGDEAKLHVAAALPCEREDSAASSRNATEGPSGWRSRNRRAN